MLKLHYHPSDASLMSHILLEELGVPFQLEFVDRSHNAQKSAAYLKLNPNGLIPVLEDDDLVLYETPAILLHLADTHPKAQLVPAMGTPQRAHCYKWLAWLSNTLQANLVIYFYAERYVREGNTAAVTEVQEAAQQRIGGFLDQIETELLNNGGPWLLGSRFSAVDCMAFVLCCWTRNFDCPASSRPAVATYLTCVRSRPAVQRATATEQLPESFFKKIKEPSQ